MEKMYTLINTHTHTHTHLKQSKAWHASRKRYLNYLSILIIVLRYMYSKSAHDEVLDYFR